MNDSIRVFVGPRTADVPRGSSALDAVSALDPGLADEIRGGRRRITDSRGLDMPLDAVLEAGAILRVVGARS